MDNNTPKKDDVASAHAAQGCCPLPPRPLGKEEVRLTQLTSKGG